MSRNKGSRSDHSVAHLLKSVKNIKGRRCKFNSSILFVSIFRCCCGLFGQNTKFIQWETVHCTTAKNIKDTAIALQCISGYDPKDATSIKTEVPNFSEDCESDEFEHVVGLASSLINSLHGLNSKFCSCCVSVLMLIKY